MLDLFDHEAVGWLLQPRITADIVTDALAMAWFRRKLAPGLIHHSDWPIQCASFSLQAKLAKYGMLCSLSCKGNCWYNTLTESFKNERAYGERITTRAEMTAASFDCIEVFYNRKRLHSALGYKSPVQFLKDWLSVKSKLEMSGFVAHEMSAS